MNNRTINKMVAIVYSDDGPNGPCGQSCTTTSAWTRVYLFDNEDEAYNWSMTYSFPKRKRSKVIMCFMDIDKSAGCQSLEFPLNTNYKLDIHDKPSN